MRLIGGRSEVWRSEMWRRLRSRRLYQGLSRLRAQTIQEQELISPALRIRVTFIKADYRHAGNVHCPPNPR